MKKILMVLAAGFLMFCMTGMAGATPITRADFSSNAFEYDFEGAALGADVAFSGLVRVSGGTVSTFPFAGPDLAGTDYFGSAGHTLRFDFADDVSAVGMDVFSGYTEFNLTLFDKDANLLATELFAFDPMGQYATGFIGLDYNGSDSIGYALLSTTGNYQFDIDNIIYQQAGSPVPEPGTMLLFGFGIAGLAGISRKQSIK